MTTPPAISPTEDPARRVALWRRPDLRLTLALLAFAIAVFFAAERLADWRFAAHQKAALKQAQQLADAVAGDLQLPFHAGLAALALAQHAGTLAAGQADPGEAAFGARLLEQLNQQDAGLGQIRVAAADGRLLVPAGSAPPVSIAGRDFFKALLAAAPAKGKPAIAIGRPSLEPATEMAGSSGMIPLARGIADGAGGLAGVVLVGLSVDALAERMNRVGQRDAHTLACLRLVRLDDGATLAGAQTGDQPGHAEQDTRDLLARMRGDPRGNVVQPGSGGTLPHLVAWARLNDLPLAVYVGRDADPLLVPANREILLIRIAAAGIVLFAAVVAALVWRSIAHARTRAALAVARARQEATEAARAEMEQSIDNLPVAIYRCEVLPDDSYMLTYMSRNANTALGPNLVERAEPGFWVSNAVPEDRGIVAEFRRRARENGVATQEFRLLRPDGGFTWVRNTTRYLRRDPQGGGTAVGSLENIHEEIRLREEVMRARIEMETLSLIRAYEQVNDLISDLPVVIFHFSIKPDGEMTRLFTSSNAATVFGPGPGDIAHAGGFLDRALPEDRHLLRAHLARLHEADQATVEFRIQRNDIGAAWVRTQSRVIRRHPDGTVEIAGTSADISDEVRLREQITRERIASETAAVSAAYETLNRVLTDLPIAVVRVLCHPDDRLEPLFHSAGMEKVFGPPPPGVKDPLRLTERVSATDRRRILDGLLEMRTGRPFPPMEVACRRGDGQTRWMRLHAHPTKFNPDGSFEYIGTMMDISEERQNRIRTEINARLSTLGEMATGIAHELNQPLFLMTMAAENAAAELQKPTPNRTVLAQSLERVRTQGVRAGKIIEHLQAFTRQDSEREEPVSLAAAIQGALSLVGSMMQQWQIELRLHLSPGLPPILGQPTRIEQVLVNLLLNARDALNPKPVGQRRITLFATADGDAVRLQVADTGGGIPEAILPRIFEPFFTTKGPDAGTGLGLSICHGAMRTMGGDITVRNSPDSGAVFTLTFRAAQAITVAA